MEKNEIGGNWLKNFKSLVFHILTSKIKGINECQRCPLSKSDRNLPEIGALAGEYNWQTLLSPLEKKPEIMVVLGPSGRNYLTGAPDIPNREWSDLIDRLLKLYYKGDSEPAVSALLRAFELRISDPLNWPKGGWFYNFLTNFGRKKGKLIIFTRSIKCGVRGLNEEKFFKAHSICVKYLIEEIKVIHPMVIITIGNDNFNFFKNLVRENKAFLVQAYSSLERKRIGKRKAFEEGLVRVHANGIAFQIKMRSIKPFWLIPLLNLEFFLNYFDAFINVIKILRQYSLPKFPLGEYFDYIENLLVNGPASVYLYPLWSSLMQLSV